MIQKYDLKNLDCANCAAKIEDAVQKAPGVRFANVDFATATLYLDADDFSRVEDTIKQVEPEIKVQEKGRDTSADDHFALRREMMPILLAVVLFIIGLVFQDRLLSTPFGLGEYLVFGSAYAISGWKVVTSAIRNILRGKVFDEHFLMTVATLGAIAIGEIPEAVGVMIFYMIGEFLQNLSVKRSRRSIQALLEIRPDRARLVTEGGYQDIHPEDVQVGDTIMVVPGERIPLDGKIMSGYSWVDTSPLTGEATPVRVHLGDSVLAGSINKDGMLTLVVTHPFSDSSIARILALVEGASSRKAETEKFITKFARVYSPIVVFGALGVAVLPPLFLGASFSEWLYRALVILVISCPCALVISIPLGYFGGVGGASRRGILVKGSNFLDTLSAVKTVVFDKTGTLTQGVFKVTRIIPYNGYSEEDLLQLAAQAEAGSNHPIAKSIRKAFGETSRTAIQDYQEIAGHGVQTTVEGQVILAGNDPLLHRENIPHDIDSCNLVGTVVHVAVDGNYAGYILISDEIKADAVEAVQALRSAGVEQILMLSGDNQETSAEIAAVLSLDGFRAGLLPEDKVAALEEIFAQREDRGTIAFIGDGINDAPALVRADVGIAMGALGSEAAIETADVVIMTDSPSKVAEAIQIGRKTRRIVWQNITLALIIKVGFIALGIAGSASMWQAVFADMGVALLAVFNATRILADRG
ncbi:MAG: cadmium-translocating P-type ATPase [Anaerolineales bacterium]|nr:cadmium-translocating P-type ATPase [Anaerolineales bacterium]